MQFLINRRVNSRVVGEGTRVICKTPDRKICIHSINNHEIIDISLVIARKVNQTTSREVIVILNKYTYYRKGKIYSSSQIEFLRI